MKPERNITIEQVGHYAESQKLVAELVHSISEGTIKTMIEKECPVEEDLWI